MDLLQNPFHILGATTQATKQQIVDLAERALLQDADESSGNARRTLMNPKKRIAAEIAWLPGVTSECISQLLILLESSAGNQHSENKPMRTAKTQPLAAVLAALPYTDSSNVADSVLGILKSSPTNSSETDSLDDIRNLLGIGTLHPLAHANLLAARIARLPDYTLDDVTEWILEIARVFEKVKPEETLLILNQERKISGLTEIRDLSVITAEIQNRRYYYRQIIRSALESLSIEDRAKAVNTAVEAAEDPFTVVGSTFLMKDSTVGDRWPILIEDLVEVYEVGIQGFLDRVEENIEVLNQRIRKAADAKNTDNIVTPIVSKFIRTIKDWDAIAQPIQISRERQGLSHEESLRVGKEARQLAIYLYNEHDNLEFSRQLIGILKDVFAEIPELAEQLAEDAEALDKIATAEEELSEVLENLKTHIDELQWTVTLANIQKQVEALREAVDTGNPDYILASRVRELVHAVKKWDALSQSIEANYTIMTLVGDLALHLLNEHNKPDLALQIIEVTRDVFPKFLDIFPGFLVFTDPDIDRLTDPSFWDDLKSELPIRLRYGLLTDEIPTVNDEGVVEIPCSQDYLLIVSDTDKKIIAEALTEVVGRPVDIELVPLVVVQY